MKTFEEATNLILKSKITDKLLEEHRDLKSQMLENSILKKKVEDLVVLAVTSFVIDGVIPLAEIYVSFELGILIGQEMEKQELDEGILKR